MFEAVEGLVTEHRELEGRLADPAIHADQGLARRLNQRYAELSAIVRRAEGNAFFVEELVGAATQPGSWVPEDLADVLLVRLDRLNDAGRQVVRVASVAGSRS